MRASCFRLLVLWTALLPPAAAAQWPGEVDGRVVDALTGRGVEAAAVVLSGASHSVLSDASGRFRLRAVSAGRHELRVERPGYVTERIPVRVEHGRTARVEVELSPVAVELRGVAVRAARAGAGAYRVVPGGAGTAGARTLADLVEGLPGVTVTGRGTGAARTVSVRGGGSDAVLVLVDGVPLNDPLTGEADLSLVPADAVEEVTVLPGARSARYGPRAEVGVILVRTGGGGTGPRARASAGSLGRVGSGLGWGGAAEGLSWSLSASAESLDGAFPYERDASVGGGRGERTNADLSRWGLRGSLEAAFLGGSIRLAAATERLERGLPGPSFAPSPAARQEERRHDASAAWSGTGGVHPLELEAYGTRRWSRYRDPAPPSGLPWDERTRLGQAGLRGLLRHASPPGPLGELAVGAQVEHQSVDSDALDPDAAAAPTHAGVFVSAGAPVAGDRAWLRGTVRLDREGTGGGTVVSHDLDLSHALGPLSLHVAHRSAFSPPSLADRFFHAGVGVEPNPDLRAERVPSELEAGVEATVALAGWRLDGSVAAYRADVRGMIVWSPDFRFVWSPRNVDVLRRGVDTRLDAATALGPGVVRLAASWSRARVTYDREGLRDLQLRYRPRHTARLAAAWETPVHGLSVEARYVGGRLPVPADVNRLPGFWTLDVRASTGFDLGRWRLEPVLRVDRVRDVRDSMIFAFPDPGRTVGLELAVRRTPGHS